MVELIESYQTVIKQNINNDKINKQNSLEATIIVMKMLSTALINFLGDK